MVDAVRLANGNIITALRVLNSDEENASNLEKFASLMRLCWTKDVLGLLQWCESMTGIGRERQKSFLSYSLRLIRENFIMNFGGKEKGLVFSPIDPLALGGLFDGFGGVGRGMQAASLVGLGDQHTAFIDAKRAALGLVKYNPFRFGRSGDARMNEMEKLPLASLALLRYPGVPHGLRGQFMLMAAMLLSGRPVRSRPASPRARPAARASPRTAPATGSSR